MNTHEQQPWMPETTIAPVSELTAEQLRFHVATSVNFRTTEDLSTSPEFVGQKRARAALDLGVGIGNSGYNIFVSGLTGAERLTALQNWVAQRATHLSTPGDWVYVHNFAHPDAPRAIALASCRGTRLQHLMHDLVRTLREELPKAFRQEAFDKEKSQLKDKYTARARQMSEDMEHYAREHGFVVQPGPGGHFLLIPLINGKPVESPEELTRLTPAQQHDLEANQHKVAEELGGFITKQQDLMRALTDDEVVVMKDQNGRILGFEVLHYQPVEPEAGLSVEATIQAPSIR